MKRYVYIADPANINVLEMTVEEAAKFLGMSKTSVIHKADNSGKVYHPDDENKFRRRIKYFIENTYLDAWEDLP